jgi:hypothetical protein
MIPIWRSLWPTTCWPPSQPICPGRKNSFMSWFILQKLVLVLGASFNNDTFFPVNIF